MSDTDDLNAVERMDIHAEGVLSATLTALGRGDVTWRELLSARVTHSSDCAYAANQSSACTCPGVVRMRLPRVIVEIDALSQQVTRSPRN